MTEAGAEREDSWSDFEERPRDPHWLNARNWHIVSKTYESGECCADRVRWACEVPRSRLGPGGRQIQLQPARFRLCDWHMQILANDPHVTAVEIGCRP